MNTQKRNLEIGEVVYYRGRNISKHVVYEITQTPYSRKYSLIDISKKELIQTMYINSENSKANTGFYCTDSPSFLKSEEFFHLISLIVLKEREKKELQEKIFMEQIKTKQIGEERLRKCFLLKTKAAIVASKYYVDDFGNTKLEKTIILGFVNSLKPSFKELRLFAQKSPETIHLSITNTEFEYKELWPQGAKLGCGFYLKDSSGTWNINKLPVFDKSLFIKTYSLIAGTKDCFFN